MRLLAWLWWQIIGKRHTDVKKENYGNGVIQGWGEHYDD